MDRPTGLTIKRKNNTFTFTWKRSKSYKSQQFGYCFVKKQSTWEAAQKFIKQGFSITGGVSWTKPAVSGSSTKVTASAGTHYPSNSTKIYGVLIRVRGKYEVKKTKGSGKKKKTTTKNVWSDWSYKSMDLDVPKAPEVKAEWEDNAPTAVKFTWTVDMKADDKRPFTNVEYQSVLVANCPSDITTESIWKNASTVTGSQNNNVTYTDTGILDNESKTRCFRVRSRGMTGPSAWKYAKHVWAKPYAPVLIMSQLRYNKYEQLMTLSAWWTTPHDAQHPVDDYTYEYCVGVPGAEMSMPSSPSWDPAVTQTIPGSAKDTKYTNTFFKPVNLDECVWTRVVARHDNKNAYSYIYNTYRTGPLTPPTNVAITAQDPDTHRVTIAATNNCQIQDSYLAIAYIPATNPSQEIVVGVMPHGTSTLTGIQCPDWGDDGSLGFKVYAVADLHAPTYWTDDDGVRHYDVNGLMKSDFVQVAVAGGQIPLAPTGVTAGKAGVEDAINVKWVWQWQNATEAEISWSEKRNAWASTDEPSTYRVTNTTQSSFDIGGLNPGTVYYIRVRLLKVTGDDITYGPYSDIIPYYLAAAPAIPVLDMSSDLIKPGETATASWTYVSMDGTEQAYAELAEKSGNTYTHIASTETEQHAVVDPATLGWQPGSTHDLCVRVVSASEQSSGWSDIHTVTYVTPITAAITEHSLVLNEDGDYELKAMPLTVKATGAGNAGNTVLTITRLYDYVQDRPDETQFRGFAGETIMRLHYYDEATKTINLTDLIEGAHLDDTAWYTLTATVYDSYGQSDSTSIDFIVNWTAQAVKPTGTVEIQDDIAIITLSEPEGAAGTETVDIYRLSADPPELIYEDAALDAQIVDPYPAIGELGGYRLVLKTVDGDCTTVDKELAWTDIDAGFNSVYQYIDFNGYQLRLLYNAQISSNFEKDFTQTKYLGGSMTGDWLEGVTRTGSVSSVLLTDEDVDDIRDLRRLAVYSGPAHIRTKDGSSYTANINESDDYGYNEAGKPLSVSLSLTKTDRAGLDGVTLAEWNA